MGSVKRAVIYTRISKDRGGEAVGVRRQVKDCQALVTKKGYTLAAPPFVDNDVSAYSGKPRPAHREMVKFIQSDGVGVIVVWHIDRLYRSPRELEDLIDLVEGSELVVDPVNRDATLDLSDSDGQLVARMVVAVARKSSDDTRRRVRSAFDEKAMNGVWKHGGLRPYGYEWSDAKRTLVPVKKEAALVREGARRILAGESRRVITRDWHERGERTYTGRPWSITRLNEVLTSPTVAALRVHRGEVVGEGAWKPILDQKTWTAVRERVRSSKAGRRLVGRKPHVLSGLLRCGDCGAILSAKLRRREDGSLVPTYACVGDGADRCGRLRVNAEDLERVIVSTAWTHLEPDPVKVTRIQQVEDDTDARLAELDAFERDLTKARGEGLLTTRNFMAELRDLADKRAAIERERRERTRVEGVVELTGAQLTQVEGPPATFADADEKAVDFWRSVVNAVYERVVVKPVGKGRWGRVVDRIELVPRAGYENAAWPLDPAEGYGLGA